MPKARKLDSPFVPVFQDLFWEMFVSGAFRGVGIRVLGWLAFKTWGTYDKVKDCNRKYTERPIGITEIAKDINACRQTVSAVISKLRSNGILRKNNKNCEGLNKKALLRFAKHRPRTTPVGSTKKPNCRPETTQVSPVDDASVASTRRKCRPQTTFNSRNPKNTKTLRRLPEQTRHRQESGDSQARTSQNKSYHQSFIEWWMLTFADHYAGEKYIWSGTDGNHLRRLRSRLDFEELKARAEYAFKYAGQPGNLEWLKPPISFQQFASSTVINLCLSEAMDGHGHTSIVEAGAIDPELEDWMKKRREATSSH